MTKVAIIIDTTGRYEAVYSNDEINLEVLRRGSDDNKIDSLGSDLEEIAT